MKYSFLLSLSLGVTFVVTCRMQPFEVHAQKTPTVTFHAGEGWLECDNTDRGTSRYFPLLYIGKWKPLVHIYSNPDRNKLKRVNEPFPGQEFPFITKVDYEYISETVSEEFDNYRVGWLGYENYPAPGRYVLKLSVGEPLSVIGPGKKGLKDLSLRPIIIENVYSDTLLVGLNHELPIIVESWENNKWTPTPKPTGMCGHGWTFLFLPPKEIAVGIGHFEKGKIYRVKMGKDVSNVFH